MQMVETFYLGIQDILSNKIFWLDLAKSGIKIISIFFVTSIAIRFGKKTLQNVFKVRSKTPIRVSERRQSTLLRLLENVLTYAVYFIAFMALLSIFGIDVRALIAGAGVVGLAVGFGAQNLVRDIITGFFIIFEDQFSVGDYIRIGTHEGFVEEIGIRTTKIKSWTGELHIIPNGNINEVTNYSIHNSVAVVDVSVAYEENIEQAESVILELLAEMPGKYENLMKTPELLGVQNLGASEVVFRIVAETTPMQHWSMARAIRKDVKLVLDVHGIEIPFPRLVMYSRQEEEGKQKQLVKE
ncbi:mechanosensitive ion channel family protein [Bacillus sp. 2205SS5-2]|uniref:mechanosensitive ion channel family protein n=1 Tax=Bacillus sp. 2205SS5-2 TaxID=3109031 RepID=UPI00300778B5